MFSMRHKFVSLVFLCILCVLCFVTCKLYLYRISFVLSVLVSSCVLISLSDANVADDFACF